MNSFQKRGAGVLLPVFSLPSPYGIGTLGGEAYRFVDFLSRAGQSYWQLLPMTPTGYGDSPYQSFSAFAGNPYFIDLNEACRFLGITEQMNLQGAWQEQDNARVDYGLQYTFRYDVLRKMYRLTDRRLRAEVGYTRFIREEHDWLHPFAVFMALKRRFCGKIWQEWDEGYRRYPCDIELLSMDDREEMGFWYFTQYLFFVQYRALRAYAAERGIQIIGDIPLYVSLDSVDVWSERCNYLLNEEGYPTEVAGVPPDLFSEDGQLWGNPLYDWSYMEATGFSFWRRRIRHAMSMYDYVRIDHFIGMVNYYAIPAGATTARNGAWRRAPGEALLSRLVEDGARLIAEDLGVLTDEVVRVRDAFNLPGMKVLEFAFDSDAQNRFLPCNYEKNAVVYGGTHDNETLVGYFSHASPWILARTASYFDLSTNEAHALAKAVIRAGYASCADCAIMYLPDLMGLGNEARCNTPGTTGANWQYRLPHDWERMVSCEFLREMASLYNR